MDTTFPQLCLSRFIGPLLLTRYLGSVRCQWEFVLRSEYEHFYLVS